MAASDAFYNDIVTTVDGVLAELGTTYTVRAAGTYNEATLETAAGATRTVTGLVATQDFTQQVIMDAADWHARKTLILSASAAPQEGEEVQVDGIWYPLSKLVPIKPADVTVVYLLDVTK